MCTHLYDSESKQAKKQIPHNFIAKVFSINKPAPFKVAYDQSPYQEKSQEISMGIAVVLAGTRLHLVIQLTSQNGSAQNNPKEQEQSVTNGDQKENSCNGPKK